MSDRRVTQVLTEAEYATAIRLRRVTQALTEAEYAGATKFRRVTQALAMAEYRKPWPIPGRKGPPVQIV